MLPGREVMYTNYMEGKEIIMYQYLVVTSEVFKVLRLFSFLVEMQTDSISSTSSVWLDPNNLI